jgi:phage gpG-like protein
VRSTARQTAEKVDSSADRVFEVGEAPAFRPLKKQREQRASALGFF